MTTPAEIDLLAAVRTFVRTHPSPSGLALEIKEALKVLDAERATEPAPVLRRFMITYLYGSSYGFTTARAFATTVGPVDEDTIRNWEKIVQGTLPAGVGSSGLTSFHELES